MSVTDSASNVKRSAADEPRPHSIYLATGFISKTSSQYTESSSQLQRQPTRKADIELVMERLREAVDYVLNNADESGDATITLALLHQVR